MAAEHKRLAACLIVALVLHLPLLALMRSPGQQIRPPAPPLRIRWTNPMPSSLTDAPRNESARRSASKRSTTIEARERRAQPASRRSATHGTAADTPPAMEQPAAYPSPAAAQFMESARAIARELAHEQAGQPAQVARHEDRPILAALDRALSTAKLADEHLAGGMLRISTHSGRVYCLQRLPDISQDGPVATQPVATNCP